MRIARRRQTERALQLNLPGGAFQEIRAAHHVGNLLCAIVNNHRQLIGNDAVAAPDHDVAETAQRKLACTLQTIFEAHGLGIGDSKTQGSRTLGRGAVAAGTGISARLKLTTRAPCAHAAVGQSEALQLRDGVSKQVAAPALILNLAIPLKSEPLEGAQNLVGAARLHARGIEILDAQQPAATLPARIEVAAEGGNQRA